MSYDIEHPEITSIESTGYPSWTQEQPRCEKCGDELSGVDDVYEDEYYDCLCEYCLLEIHRKGW